MLTNNMHSVFTLTNYTGPLGPLLAIKSDPPGPLLATKSDPPGPLLALTLGNQKWTWEDTHELLKPHKNRCLSEGVNGWNLPPVLKVHVATHTVHSTTLGI